MITTMEALLAEGGLAEAISASVDSVTSELETNSDLTDARRRLGEQFVIRRIAKAATDILSSGGELTEISSQLEFAFARGITLGLAVGAESCPDHMNSSNLKT